MLDPVEISLKQNIAFYRGEIIFYCEGEPDQQLKDGDMYAIQSGLKPR